jgi:hypothetical protein
MNAQKRQRWIRNRINQPANEIGALSPEEIVLSPKWDNPDSRINPGKPSHAVTLQPGAIDQLRTSQGSTSCFNDLRPALRSNR